MGLGLVISRGSHLVAVRESNLKNTNKHQKQTNNKLDLKRKRNTRACLLKEWKLLPSKYKLVTEYFAYVFCVATIY